jgi:small-conductance mechanosensitive channel
MPQLPFNDAGWPTLALWSMPLAVAAVAVAVSLLLHALGTALLRPALQRSPVASTVLRQTVQPARFVLPLLALQLTWNGVTEPLPGLARVNHVTDLLLVSAVAWLLFRIVNGVEEAVRFPRPTPVDDPVHSRQLQTQIRVVARVARAMVLLVAGGLVMMTFPGVRQVGTSLLASAGVAGIIAGLAARPVLGNLIAGLQIGFTQPIRLDDVVVVQNEWGVIEEITSAYVVVRLWDERRLVVPLQWWIENPFQNWTRQSTQLLGTVFLWVDYRMPIEPLRAALQQACRDSPDWDGRTATLAVTDATDRALQVRALVSADDSARAWALRCHVRERLVDAIQRDYPHCLPRWRLDEPQR